MGMTKSVKNMVRKGMYSWEINVNIHDKCTCISLHDVTGDTKRWMDIIFVMHSRRQQSWRYGPACWACGTTMSCDIVHKKRTGPMHIKAEHRYSYLTRTNEYYGSETHSSRSCTQYDVHTYPYTSRYRPHKKGKGLPFVIMHTRRQQLWRYWPARWACATYYYVIVHKKRTGPVHIKAKHRYSYLTRTNTMSAYSLFLPATELGRDRHTDLAGMTR